MPVSKRAETLLQDLAHDHGLAGLTFDASGLITINVDDLTLAITFSEARDSFFLLAPLGEQEPSEHEPSEHEPSEHEPSGRESSGELVFPVRDASDLGEPREQYFRMLDPQTSDRLLVAERPAGDLTYPEFAKGLDEFVGALRQAQGSRGSSAASELPHDVFSWIRP